jgi:hypothetical protein
MLFRLSVVLTLLFGFCLPARLCAAQLLAAPVVEGLTTTSAVVRWTTDVATGSRVQFGPQADRLTNRADGAVSAQHRVLLLGLKPGTKYHFTAGTARQPLATNFFTTAGTGPAPATPEPGLQPSAQTKVQAPRKAPSARQTWGHLPSLQDHFDRHGRDFHASDAEDYARQAWEFLQRARAEGLPTKVDEDGVIRVFNPKTRAFGAYNRDGTTKTFFKPDSRDYFERQPGRPASAKRLNF